MGYLKGIAGTGVLLAAWICANAQTPSTQDQQTPDSLYYVETDYGWTMSSRERSGYYTFASPLRMSMRISFSDLGDGRMEMHLHFYEVSYTDQRHNWTITDFSNPEKIRQRLNVLYKKGANLKHFTELAAFEEETLGYLMALSHGMTFIIDPSEDTSTTFWKPRSQYQAFSTGIQTASSTQAAARALQAKDRRATEEYQRAPTQYATLRTLQNYPRLGMMWTQQMRDLAMFARQPAYKTLTPCRASLSLYQTVQGLRGTRSAADNQMQLPEVLAFSLCGLYRWLPMPEGLFARLDGPKEKLYGSVAGLGGGAVRQPGAWFLGTDKTYHTVEEALDETSSGQVKYRRIKVESRLDGVDAFAMLPDGRGIRGTITVTAKTTLEATLFDPAASTYLDKLAAADRLEEQAVAAAEQKNYDKAIALYQKHLRTFADSPRATQISQRLDELAAMKAERTRQRLAELAATKPKRDQKCVKNWTSLAELGLRIGRHDVAREWFTKIIREYPRTAWAADAQQRLSALPPIPAAQS